MADLDSRLGHRYDSPEILAYVNGLHAGHGAALAAAFDAPASQGLPAIQVGMSEGKLLTLLLHLAGAKKVVEFGTLAGYSALRMAQALPSDGRLWTLEVDGKHAAVARENIAKAGLTVQVEVLVGSARETMGLIESEGPFDAVFLDADKESYDVYGRWAAAHLRKGGLLLVDNAYYFGQLLDPGPEALAVRRCHEEAAQAFDTVCIPTPDGLLLGLKK
ncbi:MAG: O-methyltransferase [Acidobacteriota bacterium]|nr:O-methyltransferase [Acidobacteriota bacterium]